MIFVPFLYFTGLTFFLWRKLKCINVAMFLSAEYALTGLCAVICVLMGWLDGGGIAYTSHNLELNILPTFLYCFQCFVRCCPKIQKFSKKRVNLSRVQKCDSARVASETVEGIEMWKQYNAVLWNGSPFFLFSLFLN